MRYLPPIILGIFLVVFSFTNHKKFSFILMGLGIVFIGMAIEMYLKNKKDSNTKDGAKRSDIEIQDERTIFINAKSGEFISLLMDFLTVIAFLLSNVLNVSLEGKILLLSLVVIRLIASPITKNYYEKRF